MALEEEIEAVLENLLLGLEEEEVSREEDILEASEVINILITAVNSQKISEDLINVIIFFYQYFILLKFRSFKI